MKHVGIQDNIALLDADSNTFIGFGLAIQNDLASGSIDLSSNNADPDGIATVGTFAENAGAYLKVVGSNAGDFASLEVDGEAEFLINPSSGETKFNGTIKLNDYGAGVLTSDGSGNITAEAGGGGGISESLAIAYAIALG